MLQATVLGTTTFSSSPTSAVPGDQVTFTSVVTNSGLLFVSRDALFVTNNGAAPFVWGAFQQTMEYLSPITQQWIPIAKVGFDDTDTEVDDPTLLVLSTSNPFGTTIPPGGRVGVGADAIATLPSDLVKLLIDPAQASQIRIEMHVETGAGTPGVTADRDVTTPFRDGETTARNPTESVRFFGNDVSTTFELTGSGDTIDPGESVTFSATVPAPLFAPRRPDQTDAAYLSGLHQDAYEALLNLETPVSEGGDFRVFLQTLNPILNVQKSGPAQGIAGLTLPYPVQITNIGLGAAGPFGIVDTVDGNDVGAQIVAPPTVAPGATGTATVSAASPIGQSSGPYTDQVALTWQDRNGNVYGPISSSFTTTLAAGHPEGYLTLVANGGGAPQIIGTPLTLTATALDGLGHPVPNLPVQLVISGVNGQTVPLVTGADGTATFSYNGPNLGRDTATVTATINGPTLQASVPAVTWATTVGPPCTGRTTPLDVMLVIDDSPSMFTEDTVQAAKTASDTFLADLDLTIDQVGGVVFSGDAPLWAQLTSDAALASSEINAGLQFYVDSCAGFCAGGSNFFAAFQTALAELQGPRHRADSQQLIVFLSDGGNTGPDPTAEIAAVKAAGVRVVSLGFGSSVDVATMRQQIASSPNLLLAVGGGARLGLREHLAGHLPDGPAAGERRRRSGAL